MKFYGMNLHVLSALALITMMMISIEATSKPYYRGKMGQKPVKRDDLETRRKKWEKNQKKIGKTEREPPVEEEAKRSESVDRIFNAVEELWKRTTSKQSRTKPEPKTANNFEDKKSVEQKCLKPKTTRKARKPKRAKKQRDKKPKYHSKRDKSLTSEQRNLIKEFEGLKMDRGLSEIQEELEHERKQPLSKTSLKGYGLKSLVYDIKGIELFFTRKAKHDEKEQERKAKEAEKRRREMQKQKIIKQREELVSEMKWINGRKENNYMTQEENVECAKPLLKIIRTLVSEDAYENIATCKEQTRYSKIKYGKIRYVIEQRKKQFDAQKRLKNPGLKDLIANHEKATQIIHENYNELVQALELDTKTCKIGSDFYQNHMEAMRNDGEVYDVYGYKLWYIPGIENYFATVLNFEKYWQDFETSEDKSKTFQEIRLLFKRHDWDARKQLTKNSIKRVFRKCSIDTSKIREYLEKRLERC